MPRTYISQVVRQRIHQDAGNRCGYCLSPKHLVAHLTIDHIIPQARGGSNEESNLWLACRFCNEHKSDKTSAVDPETGEEVALFNPRMQQWSEHFRWSDDGLRIEGLTPIGRATVVALHLSSDSDILIQRSYWVRVGWHPPKE